MGCVFGKEGSYRKKEVVKVAKVEEVELEYEVQNGVNEKEGEEDEKRRRQRARRERRRQSLKPNPRLSNPPNNIHGEQVAAGWPSWLSKVAGEAIHGLTPRRADSFHKLDKVCQCLALLLLSSFEF
jgi:cyclin-dependent kinase 12/13